MQQFPNLRFSVSDPKHFYCWHLKDSQCFILSIAILQNNMLISLYKLQDNNNMITLAVIQKDCQSN